ncbi:MAG TPA: DNA-protecting protein DprA, partial [Edaphobacter sp.]
AKLTATWEDVWEDLPTPLRVQLEAEMGLAGSDESKGTLTASLFTETQLSDNERIVLERLRPDEATQLDELIEGLEGELGSPEIFTALFELELAGRVRQLPGKNYVRSL